MATLGYKIDNAKMSITEADIFQTSRKGIIARGVYGGDKFQVW